MIDFLCKLWPYLAGGLIGWLLAGWFARRLKHSEPPVERNVNSPEQLALISRLEAENKEIAGLKTKLAGFQSATAVSAAAAVGASVSSTTKTVDNPTHLKRISELEAQVTNLKSSANSPPSNNAVQSAMSSSGTTKTVDNPAHLKRISELEAQVSNFKSSLASSNSSSSGNSAQTAMSRSGSATTADNAADLKRIKELEKQVRTMKKGPQIDLASAKAAGFKLKSDRDFTVIEGIGPKINDLIQASGVKSFSKLADTPVSSIQRVLDKGGSRYSIANPGTWPDQANLAANNRWEALGALQDVLVGGVYPNAAKSSTDTKSNVSNSTAATKPAKKDNASNSSAVTAKSTISTTTVSVDKAAAKAAGFRVKPRDGKDDFTVVEGIGPKINDLIHDAGINLYAQLGETKVEKIQQILDEAGPRYKLAKPGTWPAQADMAASNKWEALKAWQDELDGGK